MRGTVSVFKMMMYGRGRMAPTEISCPSKNTLVGIYLDT